MSWAILHNAWKSVKKTISKYRTGNVQQYKRLKHQYDELENSLQTLLVVKKLVSEKL